MNTGGYRASDRTISLVFSGLFLGRYGGIESADRVKRGYSIVSISQVASSRTDELRCERSLVIASIL